MVTEKPRDCNNFANEAAIIPFPNEEETPPVTKIYFVFGMCLGLCKITKSVYFGKRK